MKKSIFTSAILIASILMASCIKETEIGKNENIGEMPITLMIAGSDHAETRGIPVTTETLESTFKIYAFRKSGSDYVNNDDYSMALAQTGVTANVTGSGSPRGATLAQPHYWPGSYMLDFYAVYPASWADTKTQITSSPYTPKITTKKHEIKENMAEHTDMLYAYTPGRTKGSPVPIEFLHALTRVTFQGKIINNSPEQITGAKIMEIKISDVHGEGTFSFSNALGTWSPAGSQTVKTIPSLNYNFLANPGPNDYIGSFFLIPMTGAGALTGVKLDVKITSVNTGEVSYTNLSLPPDVTVWNAGDWVNYTIQLDANNGKVTIGNVTVKAWTVTNGGTVNL